LGLLKLWAHLKEKKNANYLETLASFVNLTRAFSAPIFSPHVFLKLKKRGNDVFVLVLAFLWSFS
jgi:hypothetical protein